MTAIKFDPDFVSRTKEIITEYSGKREFSLLLNCLLGMIIFVQQKYKNKQPAQGDLSFLRKKIKDISDLNFLHSIDYIRNKQLSTFLNKFRNSVAHFNIKEVNSNDIWESIEIWDSHTSHLILSYQQVKVIALYVAGQYLAGNNN